MRNRKRIPLEERFWNYVQKTDTCWLWTGATRNFGYGVINAGGDGGAALVAHRVSWEIHNGPIPAGMVVCHKCDNPPCVRPDHLFLGTVADNNADMRQKGRASGGVRDRERHSQTKLTYAQIAEIQATFIPGKTTYREFAERYGVAGSTIARYANPNGQDCTHRRLTVAQIAEIKSAYATGKTSYNKLARQYGVSNQTIKRHVKPTIIPQVRRILTPAEVAAIRAAYVPGKVSFRDLAQQHGVTITTIWRKVHNL